MQLKTAGPSRRRSSQLFIKDGSIATYRRVLLQFKTKGSQVAADGAVQVEEHEESGKVRLELFLDFDTAAHCQALWARILSSGRVSLQYLDEHFMNAE